MSVQVANGVIFLKRLPFNVQGNQLVQLGLPDLDVGNFLFPFSDILHKLNLNGGITNLFNLAVCLANLRREKERMFVDSKLKKII